MRQRAVLLLLVFFSSDVFLWAGIGTHEAMYVGGTVTELKERTEGKPVVADKGFVFEYKKTQWEVPYEKINSLEYGQKAGRRVGAAIGLALINPVGMLMLFSKKR